MNEILLSEMSKSFMKDGVLICYYECQKHDREHCVLIYCIEFDLVHEADKKLCTVKMIWLFLSRDDQDLLTCQSLKIVPLSRRL